MDNLAPATVPGDRNDAAAEPPHALDWEAFLAKPEVADYLRSLPTVS